MELLDLSKIQSLDLEKISTNQDLDRCVVKAAILLRTNGYLPSGEYFELLEDEEVESLSNKMNKVDTLDFKTFLSLKDESDEKNLIELIMLALLLAYGEGETIVTPELASSSLSLLKSLIIAESLARKGEINVFRLNYSVLDGTKVIGYGTYHGEEKDFNDE